MRRAELQAPACAVGAVVYGQGERRRPDDLIRNGASRFFHLENAHALGANGPHRFVRPMN